MVGPNINFWNHICFSFTFNHLISFLYHLVAACASESIVTGPPLEETFEDLEVGKPSFLLGWLQYAIYTQWDLEYLS